MFEYVSYVMYIFEEDTYFTQVVFHYIKHIGKAIGRQMISKSFFI